VPASAADKIVTCRDEIADTHCACQGRPRRWRRQNAEPAQLDHLKVV
jgi:hypothetical protein